MGSQTCRTSFEFASWEDCVGFTLPEDETCGDGLDNDCDGAADEDCGCTPGETRACFPSAVELIGVGICRQGMETCLGGGDDWGSCEGLQLSEAERCGDGLDNDCDGTADEGFDVGVPCDGADADLCREGTLVCTADATATECDDPGTDDAEECNGLDDDCDGAIDEDAQCGPEEICRQGGCVSILVTATVGCGGGTMTADDVCAGEGFAGASEACGYWWGQCAGPGACPGGWTGVDCEGYSGFQDCAGSEFDAHPYGWSIVERCGSGQTSFSPDDFLACDGWNPGWTVRARCEP